jgi:hypothetical protein
MDDYQTCLLKAFGEVEYGDALVHKMEALYSQVKTEPGIVELLAEVRATTILDESAAFFVLFSYDYLPRTFDVLKKL